MFISWPGTVRCVRKLPLGASERERVEIVRGLKNGDWLIVDPLSLLKSGIRVRVGNPQPSVDAGGIKF